MKYIINFDMDGTIADLYANPNWLEMLRAFNPTPYATAEPLWDMVELAEICAELQKQGNIINIISWLSKESTAEYDREVRKAKKEWLARYKMPVDHFHGVKYGTPKARVIKGTITADFEAILIDDEEQNRNAWKIGRTVNPTTENIIEFLKSLLETC